MVESRCATALLRVRYALIPLLRDGARPANRSRGVVSTPNAFGILRRGCILLTRLRKRRGNGWGVLPSRQAPMESAHITPTSRSRSGRTDERPHPLVRVPSINSVTGEHRKIVHTKAELGRVSRLHLKTLELIAFDEHRFAPRRQRRGDRPIIAGVVVEDLQCVPVRHVVIDAVLVDIGAARPGTAPFSTWGFLPVCARR